MSLRAVVAQRVSMDISGNLLYIITQAILLQLIALYTTPYASQCSPPLY